MLVLTNSTLVLTNSIQRRQRLVKISHNEPV